jgi:Putative transposase
MRPLARAHAKVLYRILMQAAAAAILKLARDPCYLGAATPGLLAVLHTWTRAMLYHPHVHLLVTSGGISDDGAAWLKAKHRRFFLPERPLSAIFRGKFRHRLKKAGLYALVPKTAWEKSWVVDCKPAGRGEGAPADRPDFAAGLTWLFLCPSRLNRREDRRPVLDRLGGVQQEILPEAGADELHALRQAVVAADGHRAGGQSEHVDRHDHPHRSGDRSDARDVLVDEPRALAATPSDPPVAENHTVDSLAPRARPECTGSRQATDSLMKR